MPATKIATCCYCGTHAALVLRGNKHHVLSCQTCGAPLSRMTILPARKAEPQKSARPGQDRAKSRPLRSISPKKKPRRGAVGRLFETLWDEVEDIFD